MYIANLIWKYFLRENLWTSQEDLILGYFPKETFYELWFGNQFCINPHFNLTTAQNVRAKLTDYITAWTVVADYQDFAFSRFCHSNSEVRWFFPHHLGKVSGPKGALRFGAECMLPHFVVPGTADSSRIGFGITIGGPEAVDVLAVRWVGTICKTILARQCFGPVLG